MYYSRGRPVWISTGAALELLVKARDNLLVLVVLALGIAAGIAISGLWGTPVEAAEIPGGEAAWSNEPDVFEPNDLVAKPVDLSPSSVETRTPQPDTSGWTHGVVRGHITLTPGVVAKASSAIVRIQEAINQLEGISSVSKSPFAYNKRILIDPELGTPTFEIDNIPFSDYGYSVTVFVEGLNGSDQIVSITEGKPIADVVLGITEGVVYTVKLQTQLYQAVADLPVLMIPVGKPLGRTLRRGVSNHFGSVIFEDALSGDYKIVAGDLNAPRNEPKIWQVTESPSHQHAEIVVPIGHDLIIWANGPGWSVQDAKIEVIKIDTTLFTRHENKTDTTGKCVFKHIPPGRYQINIIHPKFERWSQARTIKKNVPPGRVSANLIPR
ncbi:MAG: hypothetical protein QF412_03285 [Planctomycetota bacterium]|nr:hypothetical protein [Planctomycetota bacterium]